MRIAMEHADLEGHFHENPRAVGRQKRRLDAQGGQRRPVVDAAALDEVHRQNRLGRELQCTLGTNNVASLRKNLANSSAVLPRGRSSFPAEWCERND